MKPDEIYELLRLLTSPVVAVTSRRGPKANGMITDGVVRASIVPDIPRMMILVHKLAFSHELIFQTGKFCAHVLHEGQIEEIHTLGFQSGRDSDKMAGIPWRPGELGLPVLEQHVVAFECQVINAMDTGSSTVFLGEAKAVHKGPGTRPMTPAYMREHMPPAWKEEYIRNLGWAQNWARERSYDFPQLRFDDHD
jgi:flavin reductase (DIM6/NTAB) family NADH-FMN oxidoreductase RutF